MKHHKGEQTTALRVQSSPANRASGCGRSVGGSASPSREDLEGMIEDLWLRHHVRANTLPAAYRAERLPTGGDTEVLTREGLDGVLASLPLAHVKGDRDESADDTLRRKFRQALGLNTPVSLVRFATFSRVFSVVLARAAVERRHSTNVERSAGCTVTEATENGVVITTSAAAATESSKSSWARSSDSESDGSRQEVDVDIEEPSPHEGTPSASTHSPTASSYSSSVVSPLPTAPLPQADSPPPQEPAESANDRASQQHDHDTSLAKEPLSDPSQELSRNKSSEAQQSPFARSSQKTTTHGTNTIRTPTRNPDALSSSAPRPSPSPTSAAAALVPRAAMVTTRSTELKRTTKRPTRAQEECTFTPKINPWRRRNPVRSTGPNAAVPEKHAPHLDDDESLVEVEEVILVQEKRNPPPLPAPRRGRVLAQVEVEGMTEPEDPTGSGSTRSRALPTITVREGDSIPMVVHDFCVQYGLCPSTEACLERMVSHHLAQLGSAT